MKNKVIYNYNGVLINYIQPNSFEACIDFIKVNFILNYITNFKYVNEEGNKVFISSQKELNDAIMILSFKNSINICDIILCILFYYTKINLLSPFDFYF